VRPNYCMPDSQRCSCLRCQRVLFSVLARNFNQLLV